MSAGVRSEYMSELEWAVSKQSSQWGSGGVSEGEFHRLQSTELQRVIHD